MPVSWSWFKQIYIVQIFGIKKVIIENICPYIIEPFHIFIIFLCQVESYWMIKKETWWYLLNWVSLKIKEKSKGIQNLPLWYHFGKLFTNSCPVWREFKCRDKDPSSILSTFLYQFNLLLIPCWLLFFDLHFILKYHSFIVCLYFIRISCFTIPF